MAGEGQSFFFQAILALLSYNLSYMYYYQKIMQKGQKKTVSNPNFTRYGFQYLTFHDNDTIMIWTESVKTTTSSKHLSLTGFNDLDPDLAQPINLLIRMFSKTSILQVFSESTTQKMLFI